MSSTNSIYYVIYDYLDGFWRWRLVIGLSIIIVPVLALFLGLVLPKKYQSTISIAVYGTPPPSMKGVSYTPVLEDQFASLSAYITSPAVLKKVALKSGLVKINETEDKIQQVTTGLAKSLNVQYVFRDLIKITLTSKDSGKMVEILNLLGSMLIQQLQTPLTRLTQSSLIFLKKEIDKQREILNVATNKLNQFEYLNHDFLPQVSDVFSARQRNVVAELEDKKTQYQAALAEKSQIRQILEKINPALGTLEREIGANNEKLAKLRLIYTDNYPGIKDAIKTQQMLQEEKDKLLKQSRVLSEESIQQMWDVAASTYGNSKTLPDSLLFSQLQRYQNVQLKITKLEQAIADLSMQNHDLDQKIKKSVIIKQQWQALTKDVQLNQSLFDSLESSYISTKGTEGLNKIDEYRVASVVESPQKPQKSLNKPLSFFLLVGCFGGIIFGFSFARFIDLMDNSARRKASVEALTGIMVITRVKKLELA